MGRAADIRTTAEGPVSCLEILHVRPLVGMPDRPARPPTSEPTRGG